MNACPNCARRRPHLCGTIVGVCGKLSLLSFPFQCYSHIAFTSCLCYVLPPTNPTQHALIYMFSPGYQPVWRSGGARQSFRGLSNAQQCLKTHVCATCVCAYGWVVAFSQTLRERTTDWLVAKTGRRRKLNTRIVDGTSNLILTF